MANQEPLNGRHERAPRFAFEFRDTAASERLMARIVQIVRDAALLTELQAKLFSADIDAWQRRCMIPLGFITFAILAAVGAAPVLLVGSSIWLASVLNLSVATSLVIHGAIGLILAVATAVFAMRRLSSAFREFDRSRFELSRNLEWIINTLSQT